MRIKEGFVLREVCGERVIVGEGFNVINFGRLISVNETASWIWKFCVKAVDFNEDMITDALCAEYDVNRDSAQRGVHSMITQWIEQGMIE